MWSPRILVLRYPIYNGYQNTRNLKWTEVSEILKTTLVPVTMPNSLLGPIISSRGCLSMFQTAKSVRDCATTVGVVAFFQAEGYRGQPGQGAQGDGGGGGGVKEAGEGEDDGFCHYNRFIRRLP